LGILRVWEGGLALYGGLTFGTVALIVLVRRWGGDLPAFFDGVAPAVPVAQAFGRLGNYFNQELYGTPTTLPWALEVDPDRRVAQFAEFSTFHPTFAYEALWNLALAAALIWIGKRGLLRRGSLGFVYAMGYGAIRFLLEFIRTDQRAFEVILTANGWVSVVVFLIGLLGLLWWQRRPLPASAEEEVAHSEAGISEREAQPADEPAAEPVDGDPAEAPTDEGLR
jgi:prolipoprotein diacylglyceryl transferase